MPDSGKIFEDDNGGRKVQVELWMDPVKGLGCRLCPRWVALFIILSTPSGMLFNDCCYVRFFSGWQYYFEQWYNGLSCSLLQSFDSSAFTGGSQSALFIANRSPPASQGFLLSWTNTSLHHHHHHPDSALLSTRQLELSLPLPAWRRLKGMEVDKKNKIVLPKMEASCSKKTLKGETMVSHRRGYVGRANRGRGGLEVL